METSGWEREPGRKTVTEIVASPLSRPPFFPSNETLISFGAEMYPAKDYISQPPFAARCGALPRETREKLVRGALQEAP